MDFWVVFSFLAVTDNAAMNGWIIWCTLLNNGKLFSKMTFHDGFHFNLYFPDFEVERLFICLLAIWISSFVKGLLNYFANFSIGFSVFFLLIYRIYIHSVYKPFSVVCQYYLLL